MAPGGAGRLDPALSRAMLSWNPAPLENPMSSACRRPLLPASLAALVLLPATAGPSAAAALALHPENPRYFLFQGRPTVLITSGEHYGALLNLDFDYRTYFETLQAAGLNGTRVFSGVYVETEGNFQIARNTLNPAAGRFSSPWARSDVPGYSDGGNKFDLGRFDEAHFARLSDLVAEASRRGIIVELTLFCPFYDESQWSVSPLNAANNSSGLGTVPRDRVYTLDGHGGLLAVQEALVRRVVRQLEGADNVILEICNEPYFGGVTLAWQHHIADVIQEAQRSFAQPLLISQNIANGSARIESPHPAVSVFNFHYATPPDTIALNWGLRKVLGDNETGFRGTADAPYRREAWDFLVAGGGLFNNLDYSFTVLSPRGDWTGYPPTQPGGGSPALRRQLGILASTLRGLDLLHMEPSPSILRATPGGTTGRALAAPGKSYLVYLHKTAVTGAYSVRWTGFLEAVASEEHTFHTFSNDGVRLWIDDRKLIDNWTDHSETEDRGKGTLTAGKRHSIRLEYFYGGGQGAVKLWWSSATRQKEPIPAGRFFQPDGKSPGLRGEYFRGKDLAHAWKERVDANVDFAWGDQPPFKEPPARPGGPLELEMPSGRYRADWIDPVTGETLRSETFRHQGGPRTLEAPALVEDLALRVQAVGE